MTIVLCCFFKLDFSVYFDKHKFKLFKCNIISVVKQAKYVPYLKCDPGRRLKTPDHTYSQVFILESMPILSRTSQRKMKCI